MERRGIALSRMRCHHLLGTNQYREDAVAAVDATKAATKLRTPETDFSLCHGTSGRCEVLLYAGDVLRDTEAAAIAEDCAQEAMARHGGGSIPWICGTAGGASDPSLMVGEAGIGYFFLRLARPATFSVLATAELANTSHSRLGEARSSSTVDGRAALRVEYLNDHFARVLRVLARFAEGDDTTPQDEPARCSFIAPVATSELAHAFNTLSLTALQSSRLRAAACFSRTHSARRGRAMRLVSIARIDAMSGSRVCKLLRPARLHGPM